jgi:predicted nucleic acid-binding protein
MVVIDTSIWIGLYRRQSSEVARQLSLLADRNKAAICGPVWVEFLGGFRSASKRDHYASLLSAYPWLETPRPAFEIAAQWCAAHRKLGPGDAIIAGTAVVNGAALLTMDRDFGVLSAEGLKVRIVS